MISRPTTPDLVNTICDELERTVAPAVEGVPHDTLQKAIGVLRAVAVRAGHEIAWMRDESDDIVTLARHLIDDLPDTEALEVALAALQTSAVDSLLLADAQASYERASHVLSTAIECAFRSGSTAHITAVTTAVQERIHHQDLVTGAFEAVGRT